MDFSQVNWIYVAGGVSVVLLIVWLIALFRGRPGLIGGVVGFAHLVAAGLNSAAPIRSLVDSSYVGYGFGMLQGDRGLTVSAMAGAVFLIAVLGAFSALRGTREAMIITAITSLLFAGVLGWPWLQDMLDGVHSQVQLGQGVIVPGYVFKGAIAVLEIGPFLLGMLWATARIGRSPSSVTA
ncbi:MAG: hypothetical protein GC145_15320 [Caulobacter sp.]|nr:hypothetical protein [Caulobacter sp.]